MSDEPTHWLEEPDTYCTLIPEKVLGEGETVEAAALRLYAPVAKKDETNEVLAATDERFAEAVARTHASLIEHKPTKTTITLVDPATGVFDIDGVKHHLRVVFLRRK